MSVQKLKLIFNVLVGNKYSVASISDADTTKTGENLIIGKDTKSGGRNWKIVNDITNKLKDNAIFSKL